MLIDANGQLIPIKATDSLIGDVEFTLYTPQNIIPKFRVDNVFLKDFKIEIVKQNLENNSDTDTQYVNVINSNFVNEFSELSFKVCSQTNKGMNYSSIIEKNDIGVYKYNQSIFNKSLNKDQLQEHNIIEKYVNQYSIPKKILNLTLENCYFPYTLFDYSLFPTDKYIVSKMSIDYFNNNNLLTIVEKI